MKPGRATSVLPIAFLLLAGCAGESGRTPPPAPAPSTGALTTVTTDSPADPLARARQAYDEGHRAMVADRDIDLGVERLEEAVRLDPGFGEAWYQLGTARLTQAAVARSVDEAAALGFFRQGVADCRKALDLMQRGSLREWSAFELHDARDELTADLEAIGRDVDLADAAAARAALERYARHRGYVDSPPDAGGEGH
jgi:hypothetical protein